MFKRYRYYEPHPFDDLHGFIVQAMTMICGSGPGSTFQEAVVDKLDPAFRALLEEEAKNKSDYLYKPLNDLFELIKAEPADQKELLLKALRNNNEIEKICNCVDADLVKYEDINNEEIAVQLKEFLNNLYDKYLNRGSFVTYATRRAMELNFEKDTKVNFLQHFRGLIKVSEMEICPFCGIYPLSNEFNAGRNAYDHFLPKGVIPFVSVNFRNLAPMCDECNSKNKMARVPVFAHGDAANKRVRAFYPYAKEEVKIEISFTLKDTDKSWDQLLPGDLALNITTDHQEEAESWKDIFGIEVRYKAWTLGLIRNNLLNTLFKTYQLHKQVYGPTSWEDFIQLTLKIYKINLFMDQNFLKYAFLKCLLEEADLLKRLKSLSPAG